MRWAAITYNSAMVLLLAAIIADVTLGHEFVLNGIATAAVTGLTFAIFGSGILLLIVLAWIVVRDAVDEIRMERRSGLPWRWRVVGYVGILGILTEGAVGAWYVSQDHVPFSEAIKNIPYAGTPVLLALASYPSKWLERAWLARK